MIKESIFLILKRGFHALLPLSLLIVAGFYSASPAQAADCTFTGANSSDFQDAANWDCGFVPGAADWAIIDYGKSATLSAVTTTVGNLDVNPDATLDTSGKDLSVLGNTWSMGRLIAGNGNTIVLGGGLELYEDGVFVPGNGTVVFSTTTVGSPYQFISAYPHGIVFHDVVVDTAASYVYPTSFATDTSMTIEGDLNIKHGSLYPNTDAPAQLYVMGDTHIFAAGSMIVSNSAATVRFDGTVWNQGMMAIKNGSVEFMQAFTNTGLFGATETWATPTFIFDDAFVGNGTFYTGKSTVIFSGSTTQFIPSNLTYYNLAVRQKPLSAKTFLTGTTTVLADFDGVGTTGDIDFAGYALRVRGDVTDGRAMLPTDVLYLDGTSTQFVRDVRAKDIIIDKSAGVVRLDGAIDAQRQIALQHGSLLAGGASVLLGGGVDQSTGLPLDISGGSFEAGTSTIAYEGSSRVTNTTFYNLTFSTTTEAYPFLNGSTTVMGELRLNNASLSIGSDVLTVIGPITNHGVMTLNAAAGGKVIHVADSFTITDASSGAEVASVTTPSKVNVTVRDGNRNMNGFLTETIDIVLQAEVVSGGDSETLTLIETAPDSGIFRTATPLQVVASSFVSKGNQQIEVSASGQAQFTYTDIQDDTDIYQKTLQIVFGGYVANAGSSGGGGLGSVGSQAMAPTVVAFQTYDVLALQYCLASADGGSDCKKPTDIKNTLVKLSDDGNQATQEDSAVYFIGADGKRHAFPNDRVYLSWFDNFKNVHTVSKEQLALISLGSNMTYKPGKKLVKFMTDPSVYAVDHGGRLRHVVSEEVATQLYGRTWTKNVDDISDAFYTNYSMGTTVASIFDFNPASVLIAAAF